MPLNITPEGSVELSVHAIEDEVVGHAVAIQVKDTGSGITDAEKDQVFALLSAKKGMMRRTLKVMA